MGNEWKGYFRTWMENDSNVFDHSYSCNFYDVITYILSYFRIGTMRYITINRAGVITRIAQLTDTEGYTIGVLEPFFPSQEELLKMNRKQVREWTTKNNKRMRAICKFLNENKL